MFGRSTVTIAETPAELEAQLAAFFGDHYDRLVRLAALVCHSPSMTEDAVQAAMEQAWRRRGTLRDLSRMKPWLDQIVVREAIRLNRRPWWSRLRAAGGSDKLDEIEVIDQSAAPSTELAALAIGLRALPPEQRAVVALHLDLGYSVEETAQIMNSPLATTRSRLRLARDRLRRALAENEA